MQKIRFAIVGALNTLIDFIAFMTLGAVGMHPVVANYASTSLALVFSFFANKQFTFRTSTQKTHQQVIYFLGFTIFGLWVLQPIIIVIVGSVFENWEVHESVALLIAKLLATVASLTWNYVTYSRFVFK